MTTKPCNSCNGMGILTAGCNAVRQAEPTLRPKMIGEICPVCKGEGTTQTNDVAVFFPGVVIPVQFRQETETQVPVLTT